MHTQEALPYSERLYPSGWNAPARKRLIEALKERVYVDEHAIVVSNGLNTYLACFPSDRTVHKNIMRQKIQNAREYAVLFKDVEEINALKYLPPFVPNYYMPLGLYLYFADECSRLNPSTTFLSEMRKADACFKEGDKRYPDVILNRVQNALRNAGLGERNLKILSEWARTNAYTIGGEWHGIDENGSVHGSYALLARDICLQKTELTLNAAISFAIGNKDFVQGKNSFAVLAMIRMLTQKSSSENINPAIAKRIELGNSIRDKKIEDAIEQKVPLASYSPARRQKTEKDASRLLAFLPDTALEMLFRRGYTIVYSNADSLDNILPLTEADDYKNSLLKQKDCKAFKDHPTCSLFVSNGRCTRPELNVPGSNERYARGAQALLHETMHIMLRYVTDEEKARLYQALQNLQEDIAARKPGLPAYFDAPLKTVDAFTTLGGMLNVKSARYSTYGKEERSEEIICNLYSMMHTEFPVTARHDNPYRDMPSLKALAHEIDSIEQVSLKHLREETTHIEMPVQNRAVVH